MSTLYVTAQLGEGRTGLPTAWQLRAVDGTVLTDWSTDGVSEISLEPGAFLVVVDVGSVLVGQLAVAGEVEGDWEEMACELFTADDLVDGGVVGPGAISFTYTLTNALNDDPIPGADIWVTTDEAGDDVVAGTLVTDAFGRVTFMLDAGTYFVWRQAAGWTFDPNPDQEVVS